MEITIRYSVRLRVPVTSSSRFYNLPYLPKLIHNKSHNLFSVQWHANCKYIATGLSDKTVRLWYVRSGECVRILIGHRSMILSLAMSPDGRFMASGDEDGTIMMRDLSTGRYVTPLIGHTSCVWTCTFSETMGCNFKHKGIKNR